MSFADEDEFAAFIGRDRWLPMLTAEALANAFVGFPLNFAPGRDMDWLAVAVRRSLAITMRNASEGPERTSNVEIRKELERLADTARVTWQETFRCTSEAESRLWDYAWRNWDGEGGNVREPLEYRRFKSALSRLGKSFREIAWR